MVVVELQLELDRGRPPSWGLHKRDKGAAHTLTVSVAQRLGTVGPRESINRSFPKLRNEWTPLAAPSHRAPGPQTQSVPTHNHTTEPDASTAALLDNVTLT